MKMCLNQFFRSSRSFATDGVGDCSTCVTDDRNIECRNYCPIGVTFMEVTNENRQSSKDKQAK